MSEIEQPAGGERLEPLVAAANVVDELPHQSADIPLAGRQAIVQVVRALAVAAVAMIGALCGYIVGRLV